ncbi:hypothetical protein [Puia sp.]|jgi:hypothetical protein|uniref:hypothetical protein n=1 Tax=Puia sp. TaxID=2045100 RepID=UPI002F42F275
MTREKLIQTTESYFPGYTGIILGGSQVNRNEIYVGSDVDVMVFHPDYGGVVNRKIRHGDYRFDFTLAPLFDIENTVYNLSSDTRGAFLTLVVDGVILADTGSIVKQIKQFVQSVYDRISSNTHREYARLMDNLEGLNVVFNRELLERERLFFVCELVATILTLETMRIRHWRPSLKHRVRILHDKDRRLTDELMNIIRNAVQEDSLKGVTAFLAQYNKSQGRMGLPVKPVGRLITDLSFAGYSLKRFTESILPIIRRHPSLGDRYRYHYASQSNYWPTYQHDCSILFDAGDPGQAMDLVDQLQTVLEGEGLDLLEISTIFPKERGVNEAFDQAIEKLNSLFCEWNTALLKEDRCWELRWKGVITVCYWLMRKLEMSRADLVRANTYLTQRWLIRRSDLRLLSSHESVREYRVEKYRILQDEFKKNKSLVLAAMAGMRSTVMAEAGDTVMTREVPKENVNVTVPTEVLAALEQMLADRSRYASTLPFLDPVLDFIQIENPAAAFFYITIVEEMVLMLNLTNEQKNRCFYFMNAAEG